MVVICGMSPDRVLPKGEKWGMLWDDLWYDFDRLFDPHPFEEMPSYVDIDRLEDAVAPIHTRDNYPLKEVIDLVGDYFQCTISYMIGMAILEGKDFILTGVSGSEEYSIQRPNLEYLIGFARGRGLKAEVIGDSDLLKYNPIHYGERYGDIHIC